MPYFLDTNVLIGYYFFCGDQWGNRSKRVLETTDPKHSSTTVWCECFGTDDSHGVCRVRLQEIKREFFSAISLLTKYGYTPVDLYSQVVEEHWRIREIIEELVGKYEHDVKELIRKIRKAEHSYESGCNDRYKLLKTPTMIQIHQRDVDYPNISQQLGTVIENSSDVSIIVDAHHVGGYVTELELISGDRVHIFNNRQFIVDNTNLVGVRFLDHM